MKIFAIGQNYAKHIKELNSSVPEEPVVFMKPDTSLLMSDQPFFLPDFTRDMHHEVELVVKINRLGKHIDEKFAHRYYEEIGIGIDFTARDLQNQLKEKGLPWEKCKAFDYSAPLGKFVNVKEFPDLRNINFHLDLNGKTVQKGNSGDMLFSIDQIIANLSKYFTLKIGDLIFTGTPAGVGPVQIGDHLQAYIEGTKLLDFEVK